MWDNYASDVEAQIATWLREDGIPDAEAEREAGRIVEIVPDSFKSNISDGAVLNWMRVGSINDGRVEVSQDGNIYAEYGIWLYVMTTQGKKFFGLCNIPDTSTGHVILVKADTE